MADALKDQFGVEIAERIAGMVRSVHPAFPRGEFLERARQGFEPLALMARGLQVAEALHACLPQDYAKAAQILVRSLGPVYPPDSGQGMAAFLYLPHSQFVARYGLDDFEASMAAQHAITQRFTAEFSIRPFIERYPEQTLARLAKWTADPSPHVRRLVSEGTRTRLPWAARLREFQADPRPVLDLLERLKDDPWLYVRRSVANNLNDIGKDHPQLLIETASRWLVDAPEPRQWLVRHALRSAIKRGERGALGVLGLDREARVRVGEVVVEPSLARIGESVRISLDLHNDRDHRERVLVDLRIHFVKAGGRTSAKVFKLKLLELAPGETIRLAKTISLKQHSTRRHYPGEHQVELLMNGYPSRVGHFDLVDGV